MSMAGLKTDRQMQAPTNMAAVDSLLSSCEFEIRADSAATFKFQTTARVRSAGRMNSSRMRGRVVSFQSTAMLQRGSKLVRSPLD